MSLAALAGLALVTPANAAVIYTEDFEGTGYSGALFSSSGWGATGGGTSTDFIASGGSITNVLGSDYGPAGLGDAFGSIHSGANVAADTGLAFADNTTYTLTFDHFERADAVLGDSVTAELYDVTNATVMVTATFGVPTTAGGILSRSISFSTSGGGEVGENIGIRFIDASGGSSTPQVTLDNISLDATAVPEPTTTALLGLGGLALILRRRK